MRRIPWIAGVIAAILLSTSARAETFTTTGSMNTERYQHAASLLPNGKVLIAGGSENGNALSTIEVYDPDLGTFTTATGNMTSARRTHTSTLLQNGPLARY